MNVKKWRFSGSSFQDSVRREFAGASEIISPEVLLVRFQAESTRRLRDFVAAVIAPAFPGAEDALLQSALRSIRALQAAPLTQSAGASLAREITQDWSRLVVIPESNMQKSKRD